MILGGDANSHLGPDERSNGFVGADSVIQAQLAVCGMVRARRRLTPVQKERHVVPQLRGQVARTRRHEMGSAGGDCALTRLLELTTEESGCPFCLWDGTNTSSTPVD